MKPLLHTSCRQVTIRPPASRLADSRASMADPSGDQHISSSRVHCTRTARPGTARASSTASMATSSAPFWP